MARTNVAKLFSVALLGFLRGPDSADRQGHDILQSALWASGSLCIAFINDSKFDFYPQRLAILSFAGGVQLTSFRVCGEEMLTLPVPAEIYSSYGGLPALDLPRMEPGDVASVLFEATGDPPASAGANKREGVAEED